MSGAELTPIRWRLVGLDKARAEIADAMLSHGDDVAPVCAMGDITLLPHQQDAVTRLRDALAEFHGALLADEVGLGKTFVAIALAAGYPAVHVLAPAGLLPMWRLAVSRTKSGGISLHSLHECSVRAPEIPAAGDGARCLVIVDEAHHLRNPATKRYRTVADAVSGHDVLLLSATPIHNRPRDLRAQLRLFTGARSDLLDAAILSRLIVRRTTSGLGHHEMHGTPDILRAGARRGSARIPRIVNHAPLIVPHDSAILSAILALPAPLPARDGAIAGALIRLGLLRAWCSSDAALEGVLARRILRGSALRDALLEGRHPTRGELRSWLVGEHEVQLAFPTLVAGDQSAHSDSGSLIRIVDMHVDALGALRRRHRQCSQGDEARTRHLRAVLNTHSGVPVVAFSQFADTVRSLHRALADIAGVGMLTATGARIASGKVSRSEMLARFAPLSQGVPPPPPHGAVRFLLSTDMLAEGVNLQDAGIVIHLDLPWTDALRQQRVGRVARLGSTRARVHVFTMASPPGAEAALRQLERMREKAAYGEAFIGGPTMDESAADDATAVRAILQSWRSPSGMQPIAIAVGTRDVPVALAGASRARALLLMQSGSLWQLVVCGAASDAVTSREELVEGVGQLRSMLESIGTATEWAAKVGSAELADLMAPVERLAGNWLATRAARDDAGATPDELSAVQRDTTVQIHAVLANTSTLRRSALSARGDRALEVVRGARGEAAQRALGEWLSSFSAENSASWLDGWSNWALLRTRPVGDFGAARAEFGVGSSCASWRVRAAVLLRPPVVD